MRKRIVFDIFVLVMVLCSSWWVSLCLVGIGAFIFGSYFEAILFGIIVDLLYGTATSFGFGMVGLVAGFVMFLIMPRIKSLVRST